MNIGLTSHSGLFDSISANYKKRMHGELDWIDRKALYAVMDAVWEEEWQVDPVMLKGTIIFFVV